MLKNLPVEWVFCATLVTYNYNNDVTSTYLKLKNRIRSKASFEHYTALVKL